uniref:Uncharacterized protein n=1 Tax=Panagrellus redivivus TaxID=6233 RepID=A0A7E4VJ06_PANRE
MFSRWCLIFGVTLIAFSIHSYGKVDWNGPNTIEETRVQKPDSGKWDRIQKDFDASVERSRGESAARSKKFDEDNDKIKKGIATGLILAIVLPIVGCVLLLICCGVAIGVTVCCICKKQKAEKK